MEYFRLLNLSREPFSNSPDPDFFYHSDEHLGCLQKLELAIRLRRGLNVVIGDIGTGKTTLCRHLIRIFATDEQLQTHLILDPDFGSPLEFLSSIAEMFGLTDPLRDEQSTWQIKENIKNYLLKEGVGENRTVVLIIDEGQKAPGFCLEILRELLNYETNECKLLQIVIFAQREFQQTLAAHPNFADRINFYHVITPLNFRQTRKLLQFRLHQAKDGLKEPRLFTFWGLLAVYRATGGYPRKIIHLCHRVLMTMIIQNRSRAGWSMVRWCSKMLFPADRFRIPWMRTAALAASLIAVFAVIRFAPQELELSSLTRITRAGTALFSQPEPPAKQLDKPAEVSVPRELPQPEPAAPEPAGTIAEPVPDQNLPRLATDPLTSRESPQAEDPAGVPSHKESQSFPRETVEALWQWNSDAGAEISKNKSHLPEVLGKITVRPGDHLEKMIRRVYGTFDQGYLKAVIRENQHLTNPEILEVGKLLIFPALPVEAGPLTRQTRWVQVAERNTLDDAYQLLKAYPPGAPPVVMLPSVNSEDPLRFFVFLRNCCADQRSAEVALNDLPPALAPEARIVGRWEAEQIIASGSPQHNR